MTTPSRIQLIVLAIGLVLLAACNRGSVSAESAPMRPPDEAFWKIWGDGQAEVASYDLTFPRYSAARDGLAITVFVTETFSWQARVKADPGKHPPADQFSVMKLNLVEDFQTGIYDYNEQTSSFLALTSAGGQAPGYLTKVSFSSQEWCGHSWAQWLTKPGGLAYSGHSYFDGEADRSMGLPYPPGGIAEEQLFFWARGMAEPMLGTGQSVEVPFLPSLQHQRHAHQSAMWTTARLSRAANTFTAEVRGGPRIEILVEPQEPRRILRWESSTGEKAQLVKSERLQYWKLNGPDGEAELSRLGLRRRSGRTP